LRRAISYLRVMPVVAVDGFTFDIEFETDGETVRLEAIRDSDGKTAGTAIGARADELIKHAQNIARNHAQA
jgi:hypothetical protein